VKEVARIEEADARDKDILPASPTSELALGHKRCPFHRKRGSSACAARAPEFNPDEQVWNHAKGRLAKLFIDSKATLKSSVPAILRSIQKQSNLIRSFFQMEFTSYVWDRH
jgi:hypothetical protein